MTVKEIIVKDKGSLRTRGAIFALPDYAVVQVTGKDAERFLHAQTTSDVKGLKPEDGQMSALLDRKAHVIALFDIYRHNEKYLLLTPRDQCDCVINQLDTFKFADKVDFEKQDGIFFAIQGPRARRLLMFAGATTAKDLSSPIIDLTLFENEVTVFSRSVTGEEGYILFLQDEKTEAFLEKLRLAAASLEMVELDEKAVDAHRIEAGLVSFGIDLTEEILMPETGLDHTHVSYTKGCFLGQEVLARVKSHGAPSKGLVGLVFAESKESETQAPFPLKSEVHLDSQPIAWIQSNCYSPTLKRYVAIAYVKREYRVVGKTLAVTIGGKQYQVEVSLLPLISPPNSGQRARQLYEEALDCFAREKDDDETSHAESLLREALILEPAMEDAYEALGVILSRRNRLDEAVILMKTLVELNANSVMAHANLSVFYMQQKLIEKAEEEKAISMSIRMRMAAKEATRERQQEEESKRLKEEATGRMDMFRQVLEIDAEDLLALSGMGNCLVMLKEFERALPYLRKAIEVKPTHTVAYVDLARALAGLNEKSQAAKTLEKGIEVASKRGDMMPLKEMQAQLKELT
ncbi:MAG: hypothetical protein IT342_13440 [Candidatus Melainabacteria bacterium]|nr:hypothetical protein [Candidatus Melainabacteria bacterium]